MTYYIKEVGGDIVSLPYYDYHMAQSACNAWALQHMGNGKKYKVVTKGVDTVDESFYI